MQKYVDCVIRNGNIFYNHTLFHGSIGVDEGRIVYIGKDNLIVGKKEMDADGDLVLPGGIDTHVHIREPEMCQRGTFQSETAAAAAGGITTIFEMPISAPPQYCPEILQKRIDTASAQSYIDFAFYGAAGRETQYFKALAEAGIIGFKTFLFSPLPGRDQEFRGTCMDDDGALWQGMKAVAETGLTLAVHAENDAIIQRCTAALRNGGRKDFAAHGLSRPPHAEVQAVEKIIRYASLLNIPVSFCHVSCPGSLLMIKKAKAKGQRIFAETCPQYLFLNEESALGYGPYAKFNPPIRSRCHQEEMWPFLLDGTVDYVGSDHGAFLFEEKERGWDDIFNAPAGSVGFEVRLPLLMTAVKEKKISLAKAVDLLSRQAAQVFDLHPQKGSLLPGADADLIIVDVKTPFIVKSSDFLTNGREIARLYEGQALYGKVLHTMVRGRFVYSRGYLCESGAGWGKYINTSLLQRRGSCFSW